MNAKSGKRTIKQQ